MIRSIIDKSNIIPHVIKGEIYGILCRLVKLLMMSELEIVYLSSLLERIGWESYGFCIHHHLFMSALDVKV